MTKFNSVTFAGYDDPTVNVDIPENDVRNDASEIGELTLKMVKELVIGDKKRHLLVIIDGEQLRISGNPDIRDLLDIAEMVISTYGDAVTALRNSKGGSGLPPEEGSQQT